MLREMIVGLAVVIPPPVAGSAGTVHSAAAGPAAVRLPDDVSGTWRGSHGRVAASVYTNTANWFVRINDDATFEATVKPAPAANNRAKTAAWTGSVTATDSRVVLRSDARWGWLTLQRSDDILYGVTTDPWTGADVMISLEREAGS